MSAPAPKLPPSPAPGWRTDAYTRMMLRHYAWFIVVTFAAILAAVTAINVSSDIGRIWREGAVLGTSGALTRVVRYVGFRLLDNGAQISAMAFLLGIVWAEAAHAASGRLTMIRTVGMPFLRRARALFILALVSVPVQFMLDNIVRPYAFMALSTQGLGEYGWDFASERAPKMRWISLGNATLQARLSDAPEPKFEAATLYTFDENGVLVRIASAESVVQSPESPARWQLVSPTIWSLGDPRSGTFGKQLEAHGEIGFSLSPLWLRYRDIEAKFIPLRPLIALSKDAALPDHRPKYRAWLHIRVVQPFLPGLLALCIGALFLLVLDRKGLIHAIAAGMFVGYLGNMLGRISALIVEYSAAPVWLTVTLLPLLLLLVAGYLLSRIRLRDQRA